MSILELISGALLILCGIVIILLVIAQEPSSNGTGVIGGSDAYSAMQSRSTDAKIAQTTKYAGVAFFALAIIVNAIALLAK